MTSQARARDSRPLIAHVVYRFDVGGLENGVANVINVLPRDRFRHAVVALTEITSFRERVERDDVEFHALQKPPGHAVWLYPRLWRLFRALRPAIVHTRNLAALEAVVPAWLAGVAVRIHGEHGRDMTDLDGSNARYRRLRRLYKPFVSHYVAVSRDLDRYVRDVLRTPRVTQIYNGVDTTRFCPAPSGRRANITGSPFDDPSLWLVGTVGRLNDVKDQASLAHAFARLVRRHPQGERMRLVIAGEGPSRAAIEQALDAAGVRSRAWLCGERSDVHDVMRGLDCFVLPSLAEGISNTVLEAMASGLPIVATRVGGNPEIVDDGATGTLVAAAAPDAMAQAIGRYCADTSLAARHARAAREAAVARFSLTRMAQDYRSLYDDLLSARERSREPVGSATL
jgi:sugar transferase (PEP-CTERM/EpsH1 system associated)